MATYITTPIYYVNAQPHLGHAYTTIVADTYSRFRRLCDAPVRFQTGTDEHGEKIVEAAAKQGATPEEYVDSISDMFRTTWPLLDITPDRCIRTTDTDHIATVQRILQQVHASGDIYFSRYTGLYCRGCERYLTEKELVDGLCPDHRAAPEEIAEENYFFRMSKYQQQLIDHITANPEFITPERYRNEVLSFLSAPLEDLCISRPKTRLTWGIELPFDDRFVTYVWFDALINYISGIAYPDGEDFVRFWSETEHLIAKDILKPHAIYWPTMLFAIGLPLYKKLHVHGFWNVDDTKMSKSLGNVVRPRELAAEYGVDTLRYFCLRDMSFGLDSSFSAELISTRHNSDLANDLGNLFSRTLAMVQKYRHGVVPESQQPGELERDLSAAAAAMVETYQQEMNAFRFHIALAAVWEFVSLVNKYIVSCEPWTLAAEGDDRRLDTVLYTTLESLRLLSVVLQPVMPSAAAKMAAALGSGEKALALDRDGLWGGLAAGRTVAAPSPLFPRLDVKKREAPADKPKKSGKKSLQKRGNEGLLSVDDFTKVDLRVAEIISAEPIPGSDRLLRLRVRAPEERTIVAGIARHYSPEAVVGRKVIIVANLRPVKLMGVESEGMVLVAEEKVNGKKRLLLSAVAGDIAAGSRIG